MWYDTGLYCISGYFHNFPCKVAESLFCCWPTSISSALVRLWGQQQLKEEQHSNSPDLALKEKTNQVTDGIDAAKESQNPTTCVLDVAN